MRVRALPLPLPPLLLPIVPRLRTYLMYVHMCTYVYVCKCVCVPEGIVFVTAGFCL